MVRREGLVRVEQCVKNYIGNKPIGNPQDLHLKQVDRMTGRLNTPLSSPPGVLVYPDPRQNR
jgi:hypothetical protein